MSAPLGPVGLACLILASLAVLALMVILGASRQDDPPERDQATYDAEFTNITSQYEE